jgi:hypothetical protein
MDVHPASSRNRQGSARWRPASPPDRLTMLCIANSWMCSGSIESGRRRASRPARPSGPHGEGDRLRAEFLEAAARGMVSEAQSITLRAAACEARVPARRDLCAFRGPRGAGADAGFIDKAGTRIQAACSRSTRLRKGLSRG